ncbi:hypothetical protein JCM33374_g4922 [Metschnikowia sp. JCM 33374]|nr:hypothetical protein JCM33374_g4922 [Metschnikowia sp. JCM 33374]
MRLRKFLITIYTVISATRATTMLDKNASHLITASSPSSGPSIIDIYVGFIPKVANKDTQFGDNPSAKFINNLKSFIFDTHFSADEFEARAEDLEKRLASLEAWARNEPFSKDLGRHIRFARHMFEEMADSVEMLRCYDSIGRADSHLFRCLVHLNIRLYNLYNFCGVPDPLISRYTSKVFEFSSLLYEWSTEFKALPDVRYGLRRNFWKHFSKVQSNHHFLELFAP